jgi:hypothetical protein
MWQAWDLAVDMALSQLPNILDTDAPYKASTFFEEQLTAFEVWLKYGNERRPPPEQLPIVLQVPMLVKPFFVTDDGPKYFFCGNPFPASSNICGKGPNYPSRACFVVGLPWTNAQAYLASLSAAKKKS